MNETQVFEVIIIGGSYSGLSAAMALGRSLRRVLIIDSGEPCNRQTPHSHNFITQDGQTPAMIANVAMEQVLQYSTVQFLQDLVTVAEKTAEGFRLSTRSGSSFLGAKLIFATGIRDLLPPIDGLSECWGISVVHCPYCHGYEIRNQPTGIIADGEAAMHLLKLVRNLSPHVRLFSNGPAALTAEQRAQLERNGISLFESGIRRIRHQDGQMAGLELEDGSFIALRAAYAKVPFEQHTDLPMQLGCKLLDNGFLSVDAFQKTEVPGVYACGDCCGAMRSVANAVATGNLTGAMVNADLCGEAFA